MFGGTVGVYAGAALLGISWGEMFGEKDET
jgi:hypothetical protein